MTQEEFLRLYDVRNIWNYTLDEGRCHNGTAPTIRECVQEFGRETVRFIIRQHLDLFIDFLKAKDKPSNKQRDTIVWVVLSQFNGLKITEYQLYIIKAMSGAFGKFYNTLDPLDVTTSLRQWVKECDAIRNEYRAEQARKAAEDERQAAASSAADRDAALATMERILNRFASKR